MRSIGLKVALHLSQCDLPLSGFSDFGNLSTSTFRKLPINIPKTKRIISNKTDIQKAYIKLRRKAIRTIPPYGQAVAAVTTWHCLPLADSYLSNGFAAYLVALRGDVIVILVHDTPAVQPAGNDVYA